MSPVVRNKNDLSASTKSKKFSRVLPATDGDEIVITGMSGKFPNCNNIGEFKYNLYNKIDMVDDSERRWRHFNPEIPKRLGKLCELDKFDADYFGFTRKAAHVMDPQIRILLELVHEAITDAGVNPKSLSGSKTGVYVGTCVSETQHYWCFEKVKTGGKGITGCVQSMIPNRISHAFGLQGPSMLLDTACSSSIYALDAAFTAFRNGQINAAIVAGSNLLLDPSTTLQFARLGVLSSDGYCRPFDTEAGGYTRSEIISCIFLQRKQNAKRVYASVVYTKTNCDGYKAEGITYPSSKIQEQLLTEFYESIREEPNDLGYLETHGTATVVGDPEECRSIDNAICRHRTNLLPIGSVKSNVGHSEPASALASFVKACFALDSGKIPPNIHYKKARSDIDALLEGRMKVVTEIERLEKPYIGVNAFGFGGANGHTLLKAFDKEKINNGLPNDDVPRLITWAGRTADAVNIIFDDLEKKPLDAEYIALLHNAQKGDNSGMNFRGFGIFAKNGKASSKLIAKDIRNCAHEKRPIVWLFSGLRTHWNKMGTALLSLHQFRESIEKCHNILLSKNCNIMQVLTAADLDHFSNTLNTFVGITAIQIALVDVLHSLSIKPDYIMGTSIGVLVCGYADGCLSLEQTILASYCCAKTYVYIEKNLNEDFKTNATAQLKKDLQAIIRCPKKRSTKWLSAIESQENSLNSDHNSCSSQYLINNIFKRVLDFDTHLKLLPDTALTIEIAPHSVLRKILQSALPNGVHFSLSERESEDNTLFLLTALGKLFNMGLSFSVDNLYQQVEFPVSRGTSSISQLIRWNHDINWCVITNDNYKRSYSGERLFEIHLKTEDDEFICGHVIDGKILYPATGYLLCVWQTFSLMYYSQRYMHFSVEFEDVRFLRATNMSSNDEVELKVMIHYGSGQFEITEMGNLVVTGRITIMNPKHLIAPPYEYNKKSDFPIMSKKDFYKELRLRGYHYQDMFRAVNKARGDGLYGTVEWKYNWVTFMDAMFQIQILGMDTRSLLIPTQIEKLRINALQHLELVSKINPGNYEFDVYVDPSFSRIVSGGIEVIGLQAKPVQRRRFLGLPVLEKYQFVSQFPTPKLKIADAFRTCIQLMLENNPVLKLKILELNVGDKDPIITNFITATQDLPLITGDYILQTNRKTENISGVNLEEGNTLTQTNCYVIITDELTLDLNESKFLESLVENGYLLVRAMTTSTIIKLRLPQNFKSIAEIRLENSAEVLLILQKTVQSYVDIQPIVVKVSEKDSKFEWISQVQIALNNKNAVVLYSYNEKFSGIIGLVNCLRKEPNGQLITCFYIDDETAPPFDISKAFYKNQYALALAINVYRQGQWGSYRHLLLTTVEELRPSCDQIYADVVQKGDLASFRWLKGPFDAGECDLKVAYSSINFKDVMLATGRLVLSSNDKSRADQGSILGFECSGINVKTGRRVMAMVLDSGLNSYIHKLPPLIWDIPERWSLEEAATVPVVYITVYYAFFLHADIRKGKSILIHAGTGGVGLAAIRIALAYNLEVYTTCSTVEKTQFLLQTFPQLKESHIGNSRDTSFEKMIKRETNGKGVDFVLNSLSEEQLLASIRCLAVGGHFLEIGKFDMANDNKLNLNFFLKQLTFHGILADRLIYYKEKVERLIDLIKMDINNGIIQPLPATVFPAYEVEQAFRHLIGGKHMGKVLLRMRDNPEDSCTVPVHVKQQIYFKPNLCYIIPGGLGGFGLELADWMVLRGARKLLLSSSRGITRDYQAYRIAVWKTYGCEVKICTNDITTLQGCRLLLKAAEQLAPVGGIFNLAVALRDGIFLNQNREKFMESFAPKAIATKNLDELTRSLCPQLEHFVVFSSVSCGRGNAGQTNYGMANSVMERIVEDRVRNGYPGKAVQWGAVGEVGLVADMAEDKIDIEIGGTLQQRISSCLQELDVLLASLDPLVSSMVVAEKRLGTGGKKNVIETVMNIMSIRDLKSISLDTTLSEMGMDSLMAVEIKQTLERDFELNVTPQELRALSFHKLQEFSNARDTDIPLNETVNKKVTDNKTVGMELLISNLGDEDHCCDVIVPLRTAVEGLNRNSSSTILIPGIEGTAGQTWHDLGVHLNSMTNILQLHRFAALETVADICKACYEHVKVHVNIGEPFNIIGYSFGSLIALHIANMLEEAGFYGHILLIDGSPLFLKKFILAKLGNNFTEVDVENLIFSAVLTQAIPDISEEKAKELFGNLKSLKDKLSKIFENTNKQKVYSNDYMETMAKALKNRVRMAAEYKLEDFLDLKAPVTLIRPSEVSLLAIEEDYGLSNITSGKVLVKEIEGNHGTMLKNPILPKIINSWITEMDADTSVE